MTAQILLLPQADYWEWVRSSRDFVLRFGTNLTADPGDASRYMAPHQVVTFPQAQGLFPASRDLAEWLADQDPRIGADPIPCDRPQAWAEALAARVEAGEPLARPRLPLELVWPTRYRVVTQGFGANPTVYARYGLPGHEGVDIRALTNTDVYACAEGEVYEVHSNPGGHVYGIYVRIRHALGYKTTYAHLARAVVRVGERVTAGQLIGKADSTGGTRGAHLHLLLKKDGATERGETAYPKDIIDPTPYLVGDFQRLGGPKLIEWPSGKCLIGVHARVGDPLRPKDLAFLDHARVEAIAIAPNESIDNLRRLQVRHPEMLLLGRLSGTGGGAPGTWLEIVVRQALRLYGEGIRYLELQPNPNSVSDGWGSEWGSGREFGDWFRLASDEIRRECPDARLGFPGLSPGAAISGRQAFWASFLEEAEDAASVADWLGVNCYWERASQIRSADGGRLYAEYQRRFPDSKLMVTEFGRALPREARQLPVEEYLDFFRAVRHEAGIGAAFLYALAGRSLHRTLTWVGEESPLAILREGLAERTF